MMIDQPSGSRPGFLGMNCDMGESYGMSIYGDDAGIVPHIQLANVACGFHGGDPLTIRKTVRLALRHDIRIGAHPSLPDLPGFGRREMKIGAEDLRDCLLYQIGALRGFVEAEGAGLHHVKLHGVIYSMSGRDETLANAVCDAVEPFGLPLIGTAGSMLESVANARGIRFIPEFYVDLPIDADGRWIIVKDKPVDLDWIEDRLWHALRSQAVLSVEGIEFPAVFETVSIHLDMPNAADVAQTVSHVLARAGHLEAPITAAVAK